MSGVRTSHRTRLGLIAAAAAAVVSGLVPFAVTADPIDDLLAPIDDVLAPLGAGTDVLDRPGAAPVVLTGAQLPTWSRLAAQPVAANENVVGGIRDAHNGTVVVPADARTGVAVDDVAGFRWDGGRWVEVPVQVDERFPYFLANFNSDFGIYSRTDMELTYAWDVESWEKTAGVCAAEYPDGVEAMADPVAPLDDDDEIVFLPGDAGAQAPASAYGPAGTGPSRQEIAVTDPLSGAVEYLYLFTRSGGSSFEESNGYVRYERDANADQWIDRSFFAAGDTEALGTSNTGYGPNISGPVCPDGVTPVYPPVGDPNDRFPRDGVTVTTDTYEWRASGRWMVRGLRVTKPGFSGEYGEDLIDRWKGRAFQQSPDSTVSLVGFEDEQVNWEANSALLGERRGPVRAIREIWGADSGTNVTKLETFYRDAIAYRYHLRVHPIPPDGLYTSWDYNRGVASTYYTPVRPDGVTIDGVNDDVGNVDDLGGMPAFFDAPDPSLNVPISIANWEQVSGTGDNGSLVYVLENKGPTSLTEPTVVPYYRDDACLDDGTGDNPVPRPWPGEASTDGRVIDGYVAAAGGTPYDQLTCDQKQGAYGSHGVHFFVTSDTDNAFLPSPQPVNEVDAQQWQFIVPTAEPTNVGNPYSLEVRAPLVAAAVQQESTPTPPTELTLTTPSSVQVTDGFEVAVQLTGAAAGSVVDVTFDGESVAVTIDGTGQGSAPFVARGTTGTHPVEASYAGDEGHAPSGDTVMIEVVRDDASVSLALGGARPMTTATARLVDADDHSGIAGRSVDFLVNGVVVAQASTSSEGAATQTLKLRRGDMVEVRFAGDAVYVATSASSTRS